jgi:capsular exopolysaccharide synthesis family protein
MSQLERALRRSRAENPQNTEEAPERLPPPQTPNAAFSAPWSFDDVRANEVPAATMREAGTHSSSGSSVPPVISPPAPPAAVPAGPAARLHNFDHAVQPTLVVGDQASAVMREQFRKMAASLYRLRDQRPLGIVMIVSAVPGEGKTLTSSNLALTLSESYLSRVLLVDADLRRPSIHRVFGLANSTGLKDDLAAVPDRSLSTARVSSHLDVLTAGSAEMDPMGALTSERLRSMLRRASEQFEWVIIDTPPAALLPDAKILAGLADAAVLVVEANSTDYQDSQRAVEAIGADRIVGVVLNQVANGKNLEQYYRNYGDAGGRQAARESD